MRQGQKRVIYLLELLNGTLVDTTALVDQVTCNVIVSFYVVCGAWLVVCISGGWLTSSGGFAGIDVADNDQVNVALLVLTVGWSALASRHWIGGC